MAAVEHADHRRAPGVHAWMRHRKSCSSSSSLGTLNDRPGSPAGSTPSKTDADRAVLAARVDGLEHHQQAALALGVEPLLQALDPSALDAERRLGFLLVEAAIARRDRCPTGQQVRPGSIVTRPSAAGGRAGACPSRRAGLRPAISAAALAHRADEGGRSRAACRPDPVGVDPFAVNPFAGDLFTGGPFTSEPLPPGRPGSSAPGAADARSGSRESRDFVTLGPSRAGPDHACRASST